MISTRTKQPLAAFKARESAKPKGERRKLGGERSTKLTDDARAMGRAVIAGRARQQAAKRPDHPKATGERRNDATGHRSRIEQAGHPDRQRARRVAGGAG
jgi:hypothetical protein